MSRLREVSEARTLEVIVAVSWVVEEKIHGRVGAGYVTGMWRSNTARHARGITFGSEQAPSTLCARVHTNTSLTPGHRL